MTSHEGPASPPGHDVPEKKQTSLGLYVTAREAYEMWKAAPDAVHIIDVRTPEEYVFVGHATMARNIPLVFMRYQWDAEKDEPVVEPNAAFVARVQALHAPGDTLLLICRSGGRSAWAVNFLAKAGFTNAYNVIDGTEGDKVDDRGSAFHGKRMRNGWKNSGSPWTYDCDPDLLWTT
jgi:rhodanese-related sulfurtransferase